MGSIGAGSLAEAGQGWCGSRVLELRSGERAALVFHAFLLGVAAVAPVQDASGKAPAALLEVADRLDVAPVGFVVR